MTSFVSLLVACGLLVASVALANPTTPIAAKPEEPTTASLEEATTTDATHEEETGAGCRRLTAAWSYRDLRFLFFGNTYVIMDRNFTQIEEDDVYTAFAAPYPDAVFTFAMDGARYMFSDKYYWVRWNNYAPVEAEVFGGDRHGYFFKDGLDAAGFLNGGTAFFKGCRYMVGYRHGSSPVMELPEGVPCNLDAALTVWDELWLMKDDKLYTMPSEGPSKIVNTDDLNEIFHLDNIRICAAGEKEE